MDLNQLPEKDITICPFFEKTGTCVKGELCNKTHREVAIPRTIVLHHLFPDPECFSNLLPPGKVDISRPQQKRIVDAFFIDVACMLMQFGQLDDLAIASNKVDHLNGNVIALFHDSNAALAAKMGLDGVHYAGRKIHVTLSPLYRISQAFCHSASSGKCALGELCNFIHPYEPSSLVLNQIFPRTAKASSEPLRNQKRKRLIDHPMDIIYGKSKYISPP